MQINANYRQLKMLYGLYLSNLQGATQIVIFDGQLRMDSSMFVDIIEQFYVPFNREVFGSNGLLVQDNDPKHKSRLDHITTILLPGYGH